MRRGCVCGRVGVAGYGLFRRRLSYSVFGLLVCSLVQFFFFMRNRVFLMINVGLVLVLLSKILIVYYSVKFELNQNEFQRTES